MIRRPINLLQFLGLAETLMVASPRPAGGAGAIGAVRRPTMPRALTWLGLARDPVAVTGHPRIRQRVLVNLHRRQRRDDMITASLVALLAIVTLVVGISRSPLLSIESVSLIGLSKVQQAVVAAEIGTAEGQNIMDVDLGAISREVSALPWVQHVTTRRRLPSNIEVRVTTRTPVIAAVAGATAYLLDSHGRVIEVTAADGSGELVASRVPLGELPTVGMAIAPIVGQTVAAADVAAAAAVAAEMPKAVADWIVGYHAAGDGEVDATMVVPTDSGPAEFVVRLGRAEHVRVKAASIAALVRETIDKGMRPSEMDVVIPDRPYVR